MATKKICPSCGSEIKPGSDYCLMCGTVYDGSQPPPLQTEEARTGSNLSDPRLQSYALKLLRRSRILAFLLAAAIILLAVSGFYVRSFARKQAAYDESLAAFNNEIQSLYSQNAELSAQNAELSAQRDTLAAQLESVLGDTDILTRLEILDTVAEFQQRRGSDNVKFADYGADRSVIFMHSGETAELRVHFDYTDSLLYWALEKENIVSPEWGSAWVGTTCPLMLTALEAGCCEIMFGSDYSEDVFYVLCVVLP